MFRKILIISSLLMGSTAPCQYETPCIQMLPHACKLPLFKAILERNPSIVRELARQGAKVNQCAGYNGQAVRPLFLAALLGDVECLEELLTAGALPNIKASSNQTAVHAAAGSGHADCLEKLLNTGGKLEAQSLLGATPLMAAATNGFMKCVALCLAKGANVHHKSPQLNVTPLHAAASGGNVEIVQALINAGADVLAQNAGGKTPRLWALEKRNTSCVKLLEQCAGCGKIASQKCSACKKTFYCGKDCQKKMWPSHKIECCGQIAKTENSLSTDATESQDKTESSLSDHKQ